MESEREREREREREGRKEGGRERDAPKYLSPTCW
jgi:hypothetical protein